MWNSDDSRRFTVEARGYQPEPRYFPRDYPRWKAIARNLWNETMGGAIYQFRKEMDPPYYVVYDREVGDIRKFRTINEADEYVYEKEWAS